MPMPFVFVLLICLIQPVQAEEPVYFADPNLKEAIEQELWMTDPTPADMLRVTQLHAALDDIRDLTGLEFASSLTYLNLSHNQISDVSVLALLGNLETLILNNNAIVDVSPLSGLTHLKHLDVHDNEIHDIVPLSGLGNVEVLILRYNAVSDISALSGMTGLRHLDMYGCQVTDISSLSGLSALEELDLEYNHIADLSALTDLTRLHSLELRGNAIADISPLSGLRYLEMLDLHDNYVSDVSALLEMSNLKTLHLGSNYELNDLAYSSHLQAIVEHNPFISLTYEPNTRPPVGVAAAQGTSPDALGVRWDHVSNGPQYTSYYQVLRAVGAGGFNRTPVSDWQTSERFEDVTAAPDQKYTYWIRTAISSEGIKAGDFSLPAIGWLWDGPVLTVTSTAGGWVKTPKEGIHAVEAGQRVDLQAEPVDPDLYFFVGWTGVPVEAGVVTEASQAHATVIVYQDYALRASFATWMNEIYVNDDAPNDLDPYTAAISDPQENGTAAHPFDSIQEALDVASDGASILVSPGIYHENIDLMGKRIHLLAVNADDSHEGSYPIIDGAGTGPVVTFAGGEDPNCVLMGFVLTGGRGGPAGAIYCAGSSPTITNCLIAGNLATDSSGAAVYCSDSNAVFVNCTITDNAGGQNGAGLLVENGGVIVTNSILWGNTPREIVVTGTGKPLIVYSDVASGWPGPGNIDADPLFVAPGAWKGNGTPHDPADDVWIGGDYHLQSQVGRWDDQTQAWIADETTSPCIDAGDPASPLGAEPVPNGGVINLGAYGGTAGAAKSDVQP